MITTDYKAPSKDEFRVTKTDIKNALKAILSTNIYSLTKEFQNVLDYYYSTLKFECIKRIFSDNGTSKEFLINYTWNNVEVWFHKFNILGGWVYSSNYQNTTSEDFSYTLMNTILPILEQDGVVKRVLDIDSFED